MSVIASEPMAPSAPEGGSNIGTSHVAGGGFGIIVGAAIVGVGKRYLHIQVSDVDAALIGSAALSAGVGFGHVVGKVGIFGLFRAFLHGNRA